MSVTGAVAPGADCRFRVLVDDDRLDGIGDVTIVEDLRGGVDARFDLWLDPATRIRPGQRVTVRVERVGRINHDTEIHTWCRTTSTFRVSGERATCRTHATDPLRVHPPQPEFRSHAGGVGLLQLARAVARLPKGVRASAQDVPVRAAWLLQADESAVEFMHRVAAAIDHVVFWSRDELTAAMIGDDREDHELGDFGEDDVLRATYVESVGLHGTNTTWIHPETRSVQQRRQDPHRSGGTIATRRSAWRAGGAVMPAPADGLWMATTLSTHRPDVRLGSRLEMENGPWIVHRVEHHLTARGTYENVIHAVRAVDWGRPAYALTPLVIGPLHATVVDNEDPAALGRIRVVLLEDPDRRPTPWVPYGFAYAGPAHGIHYVPEKGDLVLVDAEPGSPERLYARGSIRSARSPVPDDWQVRGNAIKTWVTRGGSGVVIDDGSRTLRATAGAMLSVNADDLVAEATTLRLHAAGSLALDGDEHVAIRSRRRIDLG